MIVVRRAELVDIPWILHEMLAFDQFFGSSRSLYPDAEYAERTLATLIDTQPFFVAVADDGERVGFIGGALTPHPYNPAIRVLSELFWWVALPWRGGRAGLQLLNAFIAFGIASADWIIMTLEADSPVNPETLVRRGFRPKETNYLLEVAVD